MRTQIHDSRQGLITAVHPGPGGIDPQCRQELTAIHLKVGGGPAQLSSQTTATHHPSLEAVRASEKGPGGVQITAFEGSANPAAAHPSIAVFHDLRHQHLHPPGCGHPLEHVSVTAAVVAEAEVGSHGNPLGLQRVQQHGVDKLFSTQPRQFPGEGHQHELLDAQGLKQLQLFAGQVEPQPGFTEQHLSWVGPEAHHRRYRCRSVDGLDDHTAMASVQTIKTAEGQSRRPASVLW